MAYEIESTKIKESFLVLNENVVSIDNSKKKYEQLLANMQNKFGNQQTSNFYKNWQTFKKSLYVRKARKQKKNNEENEEEEEDEEEKLDIKIVLNNQQLVRYNNKNKSKQILIFTLDELLKLLAKTEQINTDGTFKSTPRGFYQVVSLQALMKHFGK